MINTSVFHRALKEWCFAMHELDILQRKHWADCPSCFGSLHILVILMGMLNFTETNLCQSLLCSIVSFVGCYYNTLKLYSFRLLHVITYLVV